ncbi:MAG: cell division protein FtsH, partial [Prevotella sp.]|nr:cell division protein FtsH [Prevotella sp.]
KNILSEHREGHNELAELLIKNEVIFAEDVERIFGKRPWISRSQEIIDENEKLANAESPKLEDMPEEVRKAQEEYEQKQKTETKDDDVQNNSLL